MEDKPTVEAQIDELTARIVQLRREVRDILDLLEKEETQEG